MNILVIGFHRRGTIGSHQPLLWVAGKRVTQPCILRPFRGSAIPARPKAN